MKNLKTVTIGIPAHNEEGNILNLLNTLTMQTSRYYKLKEIIVALDGCTDNTEKHVKNFALKQKNTIIINDKKRKGKAIRLNQIYKLASSDYLLSLDADILPKNPDMIDNLIKVFKKHPNTNVVGGRFVPVPQKSFMGKLSNISFLSFEDAFLKLNKGNNIYSLIGGCHMIKMTFGKYVSYPNGTISDQNYLYMMAIKNNHLGYRLSLKSEAYLRTVSTLKDWRVLGVRSTRTDKESVFKQFGLLARKEYYMPRKILIPSLLKFLFLHPVLTTGSIVMNIFIRLFPDQMYEPENGIWITTISSKIGTFI